MFKLFLPYLHINNIPISYVDSVKYLGFTFAGAHKDDNDILRQMRTLYARSNRSAGADWTVGKSVIYRIKFTKKKKKNEKKIIKMKKKKEKKINKKKTNKKKT